MALSEKEQEFKEALEDSFNALHDALNEAGSPEERRDVLRARRYVSSLLDVMELSDLSNRNTEFAKAAERITAGNKQLEKLKEEIQHIIDNVNTATKVFGTIDRIIKLKQFIPILGGIF